MRLRSKLAAPVLIATLLTSSVAFAGWENITYVHYWGHVSKQEYLEAYGSFDPLPSNPSGGQLYDFYIVSCHVSYSPAWIAGPYWVYPVYKAANQMNVAIPANPFPRTCTIKRLANVYPYGSNTSPSFDVPGNSDF